MDSQEHNVGEYSSYTSNSPNPIPHAMRRDGHDVGVPHDADEQQGEHNNIGGMVRLAQNTSAKEYNSMP